MKKLFLILFIISSFANENKTTQPVIFVPAAAVCLICCCYFFVCRTPQHELPHPQPPREQMN